MRRELLKVIGLWEKRNPKKGVSFGLPPLAVYLLGAEVGWFRHARGEKKTQARNFLLRHVQFYNFSHFYRKWWSFIKLIQRIS